MLVRFGSILFNWRYEICVSESRKSLYRRNESHTHSGFQNIYFREIGKSYQLEGHGKVLVYEKSSTKHLK